MTGTHRGVSARLWKRRLGADVLRLKVAASENALPFLKGGAVWGGFFTPHPLGTLTGHRGGILFISEAVNDILLGTPFLDTVVNTTWRDGGDQKAGGGAVVPEMGG